MTSQLNEAKAAQAAALFLHFGSGRMSYMKLIKLLYLADREALLRWGRPITGDTYVSMSRGPVLSEVLNLITEGSVRGESHVWSDYISEPSGYDVTLRTDGRTDELSRAEEKVIREVFERYGHIDKWDLVELLHQILPEWTDPKGSAIPIHHADILRAAGRSEKEIAATESDLEELALVNLLLPSH